VTVTEARTVIQSVVEAHDTHNNWLSAWSVAKDEPSEKDYPVVIWDQWRSRLLQDELGQVRRVILVRLLVVTSVATDRTPAQRDAAVEAADVAAADFVLYLINTHKWNISGVSTSTQFDENRNLETGVLLTFTVTSQPICEGETFTPPDTSCDPLTINVNGELYAEVEDPCGSSSNIEVVDQNGDPVGSLVDGKWVVNTEGIMNILHYANLSAALADDTTTPTDQQIVVLDDSGNTYYGNGSHTVAVLVAAKKYVLGVEHLNEGSAPPLMTGAPALPTLTPRAV